MNGFSVGVITMATFIIMLAIQYTSTSVNRSADALDRIAVATEAIAANTTNPIDLRLTGFSPEAAQVLADADAPKKRGAR